MKSGDKKKMIKFCTKSFLLTNLKSATKTMFYKVQQS